MRGTCPAHIPITVGLWHWIMSLKVAFDPYSVYCTRPGDRGANGDKCRNIIAYRSQSDSEVNVCGLYRAFVFRA